MQSQNQFSRRSPCHAHFPIYLHAHQHHQFNCSFQSQSIHHHQPPCPYFHFPVLILFHHCYHHRHINHPHPLFHPSTTTVHHLTSPPLQHVSNAQQEPQRTPPVPAPLGHEEDVQAENVEVEEEAEYMFEMTDEWKNFFAKSEAKRRLKKQQQKKKGGKNVHL